MNQMIQMIPSIEFFVLLLLTFVYGFIYSKLKKEHFEFKEKIDPYYFSFTTMSTAGYGDYSPKTTLSKIIVMSQQCFLLITEFSLILRMFGYI
jgi:voltage-gated potassium channel